MHLESLLNLMRITQLESNTQKTTLFLTPVLPLPNRGKERKLIDDDHILISLRSLNSDILGQGISDLNVFSPHSFSFNLLC